MDRILSMNKYNFESSGQSSLISFNKLVYVLDLSEEIESFIKGH